MLAPLLLLVAALAGAGAWPSVPAPCDQFAYNTSTFVLREGAYLFRGPAPTADNHTAFAAETLFGCLAALAPEGFPADPARVALVDVNLQAPAYVPEELADVLVELDWASNHTDRARLVHWALFGDDEADDAQALPEAERRALALTLGEWQPDNLVARVPLLAQTMATAWAAGDVEATAVYVHCTGGVDRTGELVGAYLMRDHGWQFGDVVRLNGAVGDRLQAPREHNALKWYCNYLYFSAPARYGGLDCADP